MIRMTKTFNIKDKARGALQGFGSGMADVGRWTLKGILFFTLASYVFITGSQAKTWAELKWIRAQDFALFDNVLRPEYPQGVVDKWVLYRPMSESAEILKKVREKPEALAPLTFLSLSARARNLGDTEGQKFWAMLALYRLEFDAARCTGSVETDKFISLIKLQAEPGSLPEMTPAEQIKFGRDVLRFDADHPAKNDPSKTCKMGRAFSEENSTPRPQEDWDKIRFFLRQKSDAGLRLAEEKLQEEAAKKPH